MIPGFAAALSYFTGNTHDASNSEIINSLKEEFRQKQRFEFRGIALLASTLLILLINYVIFDHYWSAGNELKSRLITTQSALKQYEVLKAELKQKKEFLEENGMLESSRTSYFGDQLAKDLPASIHWGSLDIHPVKKKKPDDESNFFFFENKQIAITGTCQRSIELNNWMKEIKKMDWVKNVVLVSYQQDNAKDDGEFLIEIELIK